MTDFPVRGQKAPNFWDAQLQAYIDEHDVAASANGKAAAWTGTAITTEDLDTLIAPGIYTQATSAGTLVLHYPVAGTAGILEVLASGPTNGMLQRFTPRAPAAATSTARAFYERAFFAGVWQPWRAFTSQRVTGTAIGSIQIFAWDDVNLAERQVMPVSQDLSTTDLNTVVVPGVYQQSNAANATLAKNYPLVSGTGTLEVLPVNGTGNVSQRYTQNSGAVGGQKGYYLRRLSSAVWSAWAFTPVLRINNPAGQPGLEVFTWDDTPTLGGVERQLGLVNVDLGTTDLNVVTLAGTYRQTSGGNATLATNYPRASMAGTMVVASWSNGQITQEFTPYPSDTIAGVLRVIGKWIRAQRGGTWTPWTFMAEQRVDQTAGRAIYTWDDLNNREQLVYGDTGMRDITTTLLNGWTATTVLLRRVGNRVRLSFWSLNGSAATSATTISAVPVGFRPPTSETSMLRPTDNGIPLYQTTDVGGSVATVGAGVARTITPAALCAVDWYTNEAWPTALPGTANGTIPNL